MSLSASSTFTEAMDQIKDNLDWDGDRAKALLFTEGIRWARIFRPKENAGEGRSFTYDDFRDMYKDAVDFLDATDTTNQAKFARARPKMP